MYRVDKRTHRHRRARNWATGLVVIAVICSSIYGLMHIRITPKQNIRNSAPVSTNYTVQDSRKMVVNKPLFKMELPYGWSEAAIIPGATSPTYSFRSQPKQAQLLDLHIDTVPTTFAFNRAISINQQGTGLAYDVVSENCATFTDPTKIDQKTGQVVARWQGIDFACDAANYARAVVGSVSKAGPNQIVITTQAGATHKLFIAYTDNNINPDYSVLYGILGSVQIK